MKSNAHIYLMQLILLSIVLPLSVSAAAMDDETRPVVILVDRSYSMSEPLNGVTKFKLARTTFTELGERFAGYNLVAVRFFAGGKDKKNEQNNCLTSELAFSLGEAVSPTAFNDVIDGIRPLGRKTNISHALNQARQDLSGHAKGKIILISDGEENCDSDPIELSQRLAEQHIEIHTIGLGEAGQFSQLGRIALAAGGEFQLATSASELAAAIGLLLPPSNTLPNTVPLAMQDAPIVAAPTPVSSEPSHPARPAPPVAPLVLEYEVVSDNPQDVIAIQIIFDVSGSMAAKVEGQRKIVLAQDALDKAITGLDDPVFAVGLRAYGFDNSVPKTPEHSCPNTELLTPVQPETVGRIIRQVNGLTPYGYTPIAESLRLAGDDLLATGHNTKMIILISDGEETCGGDPTAVSQALHEAGIGIETHVIGFDLNESQAQQMQAIADNGGGEYYEAQNAVALNDALLSVVASAKDKIDPTWLRTIRPVQGGDSPETAVTLSPGTYTLSDYLEKKQQSFFRVNTQKGEYGVIRGLIQSRRLIRQDEELVESSQGYSQYRISLLKMKKGKNRGRFVRLSGEPGSYGYVGHSDTRGDGFVFSIGSHYDRVHKDALFNVAILPAGDKFQGSEAPSDTAGALTIEKNEAITAHLGDDDNLDTFILNASHQQLDAANTVNVTPLDNQFRFAVQIKDNAGKRLKSQRSRGEPISLDISAIDVAPLYIEVMNNNPASKTRFTSYTLEVK